MVTYLSVTLLKKMFSVNPTAFSSVAHAPATSSVFTTSLWPPAAAKCRVVASFV